MYSLIVLRFLIIHCIIIFVLNVTLQLAYNYDGCFITQASFISMPQVHS